MRTKTKFTAAFLAIMMLFSMVAPIMPISAAVGDDFTVTSPDGNTAMSILLTDEGALTYSVTQDGVTVVEASDLGIHTSVGDFTTGLTYVSQEKREINETYDVISGKMSEYVNHCNEKTLHFTKDGVEFDLIARAYDDGIAFRYVITTAEAQKMTVQPNAEITSFNLPDDSEIWYMPRTGNDFMYENDYLSGKIGQVAVGTRPSMPMLYETNGKYGLIMEADRHGTYVGSLLQLEEGGVMRTIFDIVQKTAVNTDTPFTSPWRTVVVGSAADILMNTMVENLSPAPDEQYDFESWVEPGLSSWSWVSYYGGQTDPDIHKKFIDLAADMGWKYYILDEEWQPKSNTSGSRYEGMRDWFPEVRDYADEKGVKLIAWVHMSDVDTDREREARFKEWSEAGIVGIKVDFFYNESQKVLRLHDDIYEDAAKYRLLVNVHGSNPSSGEIRTYPNIITREAIKGQEQGGITIQQYTLIPFLRAAVGSADVTEQLFSRDTGKTTMGFQIALSTLIQNGLHSMGSKPEEYYSIPAAVSYYTNFPATWDDLYVLEDLTDVGSQVNLARKSGDAWYAAGISVNATKYSIKPEFLEAGKTYTAIIYKEQANQRQNIEMQIVENITATSTLPDISVQSGGGYAIKFIPAGASSLESVKLNPLDVTVEVYQTADIAIEFTPEDTKSTDLVWTVGDDKIVQLNTTGKGASIKGLKAGTTTVTATSIHDPDKKAVVNVTVKPGQYIFDDEKWVILEDNVNYVINSENSVTITAENGVIDHNVFAMKATDQNFEITAKISGSLNANYQGGFIGVFNLNRNQFISVGRRYHTMFGQNGNNNLIAVMGNGSEQYVADRNANDDAYVRLVKEGDTFTGYYRYDERGAWIEAFSVTNAGLAGTSSLYVGFFAGCGGSTNGIDITISEFAYNGEAVNIAKVNTAYGEDEVGGESGGDTVGDPTAPAEPSDQDDDNGSTLVIVIAAVVVAGVAAVIAVIVNKKKKSAK